MRVRIPAQIANRAVGQLRRLTAKAHEQLFSTVTPIAPAIVAVVVTAPIVIAASIVAASIVVASIVAVAVPAFFALVSEPLMLLADTAIVGRLGMDDVVPAGVRIEFDLGNYATPPSGGRDSVGVPDDQGMPNELGPTPDQLDRRVPPNYRKGGLPS